MRSRADRPPGVLLNSAFNLAGLVAGTALGALSGLLTARTLGSEAVGVLAVTFGLVEFGRGLTNFTHAPSILEVHGGKSEGVVFGTSLALKMIGAVLFVLLVAIAAPGIGALFHVPPLALMLTSLLLVTGAYQEVATARYEAANQMFVRSVLLILGPFVGLLTILAFILAGHYTIYAAIAASLIGTAAMSVGFFVHWKRPRFRWERASARYLLHYGGRLVLASFLTQVLLWTDTLLLSALKGNGEAGVYNVIFQLTFVLVSGSVGIGVALLPAMSNLVARGHDTARAYQRGTLLSLGLWLVGAALYVVLGRFILSLYGPAFLRGYEPLLVLSIFAIAAALAVPAQSMLSVHGRATQLLLLSLAQAIVNVPLNYVLIGRYGIVGAAIATTSVFVAGLVITWWLVRRATGAWPFSVAVLREAVARLRGALRSRGA